MRYNHHHTLVETNTSSCVTHTSLFPFNYVYLVCARAETEESKWRRSRGGALDEDVPVHRQCAWCIHLHVGPWKFLHVRRPARNRPSVQAAAIYCRIERPRERHSPQERKVMSAEKEKPRGTVGSGARPAAQHAGRQARAYAYVVAAPARGCERRRRSSSSETAKRRAK